MYVSQYVSYAGEALPLACFHRETAPGIIALNARNKLQFARHGLSERRVYKVHAAGVKPRLASGGGAHPEY